MFSAVSLKRKWILRIVLAAGALTLALAVAAFFFPGIFLCIDSGPAKADVIIVLGGAAGDRPLYAAQLYKDHVAPKIIISGAGDSQMNRLILLSANVPRSVIQVEPNSKTTSENARFTLQLLKQENIHSAIIVTSWYHSRRALKCFERYGPDIHFYSCPSYYTETHGRWTRPEMRRIYLEFPKLAGYWVRYGVCPF